MNVPFLDLQAQHRAIAAEVTTAIEPVIASQRFVMGPSVAELEARVAQFCGVDHAIACASGTDALLLALKAAKIGAGHEVITSPFTFFATAGAIHLAGARPVFADINPDTFTLDSSAVLAAWTERTRAVIPVHLFGQMAPVEQLWPRAANSGAILLEDAAQAIGARRQIDAAWSRAGAVGTAGAFSFFPSKNLGAWGDGGMITTRDGELAARARKLRVHGGAKEYHHEMIGTNSRLDSLQAAVLLAKMPHLEEWNEQRRRHAAYYTDALADVGAVRTPVLDACNEHVFHQYTLRAERRDGLAAHLGARGVASKTYYPIPLHLQPCFADLGVGPGQFPEAERAAREALSLPIYPELTDDQRDLVVDAVRSFYS